MVACPYDYLLRSEELRDLAKVLVHFAKPFEQERRKLNLIACVRLIGAPFKVDHKCFFERLVFVHLNLKALK